MKLLQFLLNIQKKSHDDNKPKNYSLLFMHINTTRLEWNILRAVTLYNKQVLGTNFTSTWKIENLSMYLHVHLIIFRYEITFRVEKVLTSFLSKFHSVPVLYKQLLLYLELLHIGFSRTCIQSFHHIGFVYYFYAFDVTVDLPACSLSEF